MRICLKLSCSADTTTGLLLLASQALPKLCARYHLKTNLTSDIYIPPLSDKQLKDMGAERLKILSRLFKQERITWWDIFESSEIGAERETIVSRFVPSNSIVLDVGCGRGYFSFACTKKASKVVSLDIMDGGLRKGWWGEFLRTSKLLKVDGRVLGARASATDLPFRKGFFDVVASVHAIRNFQNTAELRIFLGEAFGVLKKGGQMILVESDMGTENYPAYTEFYRLRARIGWELELPARAELTGWLKKTGFTRISEQILDTGLRYAPVYFPFDAELMKGMEKQYRDAVRLLEAEGERHPPISVVTAQR
jgi:ubiquinone/menaquinone biosynthesis C-methylase UbiE